MVNDFVQMLYAILNVMKQRNGNEGYWVFEVTYNQYVNKEWYKYRALVRGNSINELRKLVDDTDCLPSLQLVSVKHDPENKLGVAGYLVSDC